MRFILSVQQNDQIATIHMGVVDVVTCCYGCRVQTVFFMGRFLRGQATHRSGNNDSPGAPGT